MSSRRLILATRWTTLLAASLWLSGCLPSPVPRDPIPHAQIEGAQIPGIKNARIWGDESSAAFSDAVLLKDQQLLAATRAGRIKNGDTEANFLAISGGGDQGAFAAGVLRGWTQRGTRPVFEIVTGVSAGALGAPFAFLGPDYDGALRDIYTKLGAGDLYKSRGILAYFQDAADDTAKLRRAIEHYVTEPFLDKIAAGNADGRKILILTTNLDAERPVIWDLTAIAASKSPNRREIFIKVLMASSAIPGIFPPVYFDVIGTDGKMYQEMHVDGGVISQLVFTPPEFKVLEIEDKVFARRRTRSLYVIRNGKINPEYDTSPGRAVTIASRAVTTLVKYQVIADLARLYKYAQANNTAFNFCAIPENFDVMAAGLFDTDYAAKLFEVGVKFGDGGIWSRMPPYSPELFTR